jgi:hypothetical protein
MRRRAVGFIAATACASILAACGAGGSSSPSAFLRRARTVCTVYYDAAYALPPPIGVAQLREYPVKQQRLRQRRLSSLRALTPPLSIEDAYKRYLSDMTQLDELYTSGIASLEAAESAHSGAARSINRGTVEGLARHAGQLESSLESQARALGLSKCAQDPYSATHYATSDSSEHAS